MSSHKYNIETGRYGSKNGNILHRTCEHCTTEDKETVGLLLECPFFDPILEDEQHILTTCPRYTAARLKMQPVTRNLDSRCMAHFPGGEKTTNQRLSQIHSRCARHPVAIKEESYKPARKKIEKNPT